MTELLTKVQAFLDRKYVSRSDERQKSMGIAYIEAERTDLAREVTRFIEQAIPASAQDAPEADIDKLRSVFEAAYGLCHGYDWNNGTAAKACGYRRKLLSAVNAIRPVPDFEGKYASPMTEGHGGWQSIDTAPDDGRKIWAFGGRHEKPTIVDADGDWWRFNSKQGLSGIPTHWQPLLVPDAPSSLPSTDRGSAA